MNTFWHRLATRVAGAGEPSYEVKSSTVQTKLKVSRLGDTYEREADRVADKVMRMPAPQQSEEEDQDLEPSQATLPDVSALQRQEGPKEEKDLVQTTRAEPDAPSISPGLEAHIHSMKGHGEPLPENTRQHFEFRLGRDLSKVRVHQDSQAADSISARAFTVGQDVVFRGGQYSPETEGGKTLLAHELTHTIQQSGWRKRRQNQAGARPEVSESGSHRGESAIIPEIESSIADGPQNSRFHMESGPQ